MKPKLEAVAGGLKCIGLDCRSSGCWHVHTQGTLTVKALLALAQKARPPARGPESDRTRRGRGDTRVGAPTSPRT